MAHPAFKYGAPVVLFLVVWGGWNAVKFFSKDGNDMVKGKGGAPVVTAPAASAALVRVAAPGPGGASALAVVSNADVRQVSPQEAMLVQLTKDQRIRLAGLVEMRGRYQGLIEWVEGSARVVERLSLDTLRDMGVAVVVGHGFVRLALGEFDALATSWPTEAEGKVSQARLETVKPAQEASQGSGGVVGINGENRTALRATRDPAAPVTTTAGKAQGPS